MANKPDLTDPEQIKLLIQALEGLLPSSDKEDKPDNKQSTKIRTKTKKSRNNNEKNRFLDMPERNMHKSDSVIDKKLCVQPPCPRTRHFDPVEVRCRICGKKEKVNPVMIPESSDRYKCNKCSTSGGG